MLKSIGSILKVGLAVAAVALFGATDLEAQVAAADAQPFIGEWNVEFGGQAPSTVQMNITDNGGQVAVQVISTDGQTRSEPTVAKSEESLLISYSLNMQGTDVPLTVTLTPEGEGLTGNVDLADGMYTAPVTATKR